MLVREPYRRGAQAKVLIQNHLPVKSSLKFCQALTALPKILHQADAFHIQAAHSVDESLWLIAIFIAFQNRLLPILLASQLVHFHFLSCNGQTKRATSAIRLCSPAKTVMVFINSDCAALARADQFHLLTLPDSNSPFNFAHAAFCAAFFFLAFTFSSFEPPPLIFEKSGCASPSHSKTSSVQSSSDASFNLNSRMKSSSPSSGSSSLGVNARDAMTLKRCSLRKVLSSSPVKSL